jgi:hypothetical protein
MINEDLEAKKRLNILFIDFIMSIDPLALIPTIDDDDNDVPDLDGPDEDDDNDEEEMVKPRAHKLAQATKGKSIDFDEQFQFLLVMIY